jgi:hypothetical protein
MEKVTQLLPSFDVHLKGRDRGDEEDGPEDGQRRGCPEVALLLIAEHDERETECCEEKSRVKDIWCQFYQHANVLLFRLQMIWISTYISLTILCLTLPVHSSRSYTQLYAVCQ